MKPQSEASPNNDSVVSHVEVQEYLESKVARRRLLPRAILVGVASGCIASAFRFALLFADSGRMAFLSHFPDNPAALSLAAAVIASIGTWIALMIGDRDKDAGGSGIPHMKALLEGHASMNWLRLIAVKFSAAAVAIGSGLALGREGPTVQMGGATGIAVADLTGSTGREKRALAAAGAGSGLAAAFNAPLAGVTFVLEELQRDFQPVVFGAVLLSAAVATVISRLSAGQSPAFSVPPIPTPSLSFLPLFVVIGALSGIAGVAFNRSLLAVSTLMSKVRRRSRLILCLGTGLVAGLAFLVSPSLLGGGHGLSEAALHGQIILISALIFLLARFIVVHVSYGTGVPGGIFAPLLSIGALLGTIVWHLSHSMFLNTPGIAACVVAGMCGLFSGIVRAPLTGVVLIAEMTGGYELLLPLLASAFTSYAVAEAMRDTPIYEALLQRDALKSGWDLEDEDLVTKELEVSSGSTLEGKSIRNLGLSEGVLIILCRSGGREFVPKADTVLHAHMKLVVATNSIAGLRQIEEGLNPP